jgi:hypothetical protein
VTLDSVAAMPFVPQIARTVIRYVRNAVVSVARSVWDFSSEDFHIHNPPVAQRRAFLYLLLKE